jgi:threonine aldolase
VESRSFTSDNTAGGAREIIAAVAAAASGQAPPYGTDSWTSSARRRFSEIFECDVDLLPVSTGSAANALSLAAATPPWGSVLCHRDSHISIPRIRLAGTPEANILFCRLSQQVIDGLLDQGYGFHHGRWESGVVRFVTSFATTTHDVDELVHAVRRLTAAAIEEPRCQPARTERSASGRRAEVA